MDTPLLLVQSLTKDYGALRVLDDVSFSVPRGRVVAMLGPNGAGKTTCFKCLLGLTGFSGSITVDGLDVVRDGKRARSKIGYVPQAVDLGIAGTCYEQLSFIGRLRRADGEQIEEALAAVGLLDEARTQVSKLSGGMKQRLAVAAALLGDPDLLLLDEPTASMDSESQVEFGRLVKQLRDSGRTLIIATHYVDQLTTVLDSVLVLDRGKVAFFGDAADYLWRKQLNPVARRDIEWPVSPPINGEFLAVGSSE